MKSQTRRANLFEIILLSLLGVIMYVSQVIMAPLPNIEIVSLLIIVTTCIFGIKALASVYIFVFCEILTYGLSEWTFGYLYAWGLLCLAVLLFKRIGNRELFAVLSAIFGLVLDIFCSPPFFLTGGIAGGVAYLIRGIPYSLLHGIGNLLLTYLLYKPIKNILEKAVNRYRKHN